MKPLKAFHDTAAGSLLWLSVHEDICQLFFTVYWQAAWEEICTRVAETSSCCLQSQPIAGRLEAAIVVCNLKHVHCAVPEVFAINASCPRCIHSTVFSLFFASPALNAASQSLSKKPTSRFRGLFLQPDRFSKSVHLFINPITNIPLGLPSL